MNDTSSFEPSAPDDVERRLVAVLHRRAESTPVVDRLDAVVSGRAIIGLAPPASPTRRRWAMVAAAALAGAAAAGLVFVSLLPTDRPERRHPAAASVPVNTEPPVVGAHWLAAYSIHVCGEPIQLTGTMEDTTSDPATGAVVLTNQRYAATGLHSHDDGVIHIHPFTDAGAGPNATLGNFLSVYGVQLTDTRLAFPTTQGGGRTVDAGSTTCDGKPARLVVRVWPNIDHPTVITPVVRDLAGVRLTDGSAVELAFEPDGTGPVMPASVTALRQISTDEATTGTGVESTVTMTPPGSGG